MRYQGYFCTWLFCSQNLSFELHLTANVFPLNPTFRRQNIAKSPHHKPAAKHAHVCRMSLSKLYFNPTWIFACVSSSHIWHSFASMCALLVKDMTVTMDKLKMSFCPLLHQNPLLGWSSTRNLNSCCWFWNKREITCWVFFRTISVGFFSPSTDGRSRRTHLDQWDLCSYLNYSHLVLMLAWQEVSWAD